MSGFCACDCGKPMTTTDDRGRPRRYIHGHHRRGQSNTWKIKDTVTKRVAHQRALKAMGGVRNTCELEHIGHCLGRLDIAHIDGDPWNNDPANLKSLCRSHHFLVDRKRIDIRQPVMPAFYTDANGKRRYPA